MRRSAQLILLALCMVITAASASAQRYNIAGRVIDTDNKPIPYATVVLDK